MAGSSMLRVMRPPITRSRSRRPTVPVSSSSLACPGSRPPTGHRRGPAPPLDPFEVGAQLDQHLGGHALPLPDEAEEDVLGADVVVAELEGLPQGQLEHLLGPRGEGDVPASAPTPPAPMMSSTSPADRVQGDPQLLQGPGRHPLALVDEAEEDVLGADVVVVEQAGLLLRQHHDPPGPVGEPLEHAAPTVPPPAGEARDYPKSFTRSAPSTQSPTTSSKRPSW